MSEKGFSGGVVVRKISGDNWIVTETFSYRASHQTIQVHKGFLTDFASVPRLVAWLLPRAGKSVGPAVVHDVCWRKEAPAGHITYREADGILRQALRVSGVPFTQRWVAWTAVRWSSLFTRKNGYRGWWRDAPLVLLWTLIALPIVLPPAVVVGLALVALQVIEVIVWVALKVFGSRKRINKPGIGVKT